jgi:hypothetical protein
MQTIFLAADFLLTGFTVGVTVWHFFLQSPLMFKLMGKETFVPLMMQLTRLWVQTMFVSSTALLLISLVLSLQQEVPLNLYLVGIGWLAMTVNRFVFVPKALKAGARSIHQRKGDHTKDLQEFYVNGGGKTETKVLHQTVVVVVLIMAGAFLTHMVNLVSTVV